MKRENIITEAELYLVIHFNSFLYQIARGYEWTSQE